MTLTQKVTPFRPHEKITIMSGDSTQILKRQNFEIFFSVKIFLIHNETSHVIAASMAAYFFDLILFDLMGWQMQI